SLRVFLVDGAEALGDPAVDGREQVACLALATLLAEEPGEACAGTQFERSGFLALRDRQRPFEQALRVGQGIGPVFDTTARAFRSRSSASKKRSLVCPAVARPLLMTARACIS